jgi:hypothetical protein
MALVLPVLGRRVLRYGIQALRQLGFRPTAMHAHLSLTPASLKRYAVLPEGMEPARRERRRLLKRQEDALFFYWWAVIAQGASVRPVTPERLLLDAFCPICLHRPSAPRRGPWPTSDGEPQTLLDALMLGAACCEAGVRPCVQSPVRFALLVRALSVDAEAAAECLSRPVFDPHAAEGLWVRTCLSCDEPLVTRRAVRHCARHRLVSA